MIQYTSNTVLNFWVRNNRAKRYKLMYKTLALAIAVCATVFGAQPVTLNNCQKAIKRFSVKEIILVRVDKG